MTSMLASVNSLEEAKLALSAGVDIVDLKQPALGALGALDIKAIKEITRFCRSQSPISATIGDLPMQPDIILNAAIAMADSQVDYIKIGFFPGGEWTETIQRLKTLTEQNVSLIAVIFADSDPDFGIIKELSTTGFGGVMLDTMNKNKGSLTQIMTLEQIKRFSQIVKSQKMLCGLAGSLRSSDISQLIEFYPDYLGFRGALCVENKRTAQLELSKILSIKNKLKTAIAHLNEQDKIRLFDRESTPMADY